MLNIIWAGMLLVGIIYAALNGALDQVGQGVIDGAREGITLAVSMAGIMAFWCGLMEIAKSSGLLDVLGKKLRPVTRWLYPGVPGDDPVHQHIAANMVANILGLGNAATPAGLKAMEGLTRLSNEPKGVASDEMCTLLVLNISSLQLIPVTMIAYRSQYGSVDPTSIVGPAIVATAISTAAGVVFCKIMRRRK